MRQVTVAPPDQSTLTRGSALTCAHDAYAYKYPCTHPLINMTYYMLYKANYKFIIIYAKYPNPPVQCPTSYKLNVHSFLQVSATSTRQPSLWNVAPRQVSELLMICPKGPFNTSLRALYTHPHFKSCSPEHSKSRNKSISHRTGSAVRHTHHRSAACRPLDPTHRHLNTIGLRLVLVSSSASREAGHRPPHLS